MTESLHRQPRFVWFLSAAVVLHLVLWWWEFPGGVSGSERARVRPLPPIEVESWKDNRPVVQTSRENVPSPDKADYVGEHQQRVQQQRVVPRVGKFREGQRRPEGPGEGDLAKLLPEGSQPYKLSEKLAEGNSTLLNTDAVKYASFVNRVAEVIYDRWVRYARDAAYRQGAQLAPKSYVTKLEVVMDREGNVTEITVLQASGVELLDEAPKRAFWENSPFRNPPQQMFQSDGYLHFVYEFHFEWKNSSFQIVPWL